jgi:hypothetical protein
MLIPFSLSRIIMSGLLLGIVLSVCTHWFHSVVTMPTWFVTTGLLLLLLLLKWSLLVTALKVKWMMTCVLIVSPIIKVRDPECICVHHDQENDVMKPTIIHSYCSCGEALICLIWNSHTNTKYTRQSIGEEYAQMLSRVSF